MRSLSVDASNCVLYADVAAYSGLTVKATSFFFRFDLTESPVRKRPDLPRNRRPSEISGRSGFAPTSDISAYGDCSAPTSRHAWQQSVKGKSDPYGTFAVRALAKKAGPSIRLQGEGDVLSIQHFLRFCPGRTLPSHPPSETV